MGRQFPPLFLPAICGFTDLSLHSLIICFPVWRVSVWFTENKMFKTSSFLKTFIFWSKHLFITLSQTISVDFPARVFNLPFLLIYFIISGFRATIKRSLPLCHWRQWLSSQFWLWFSEQVAWAGDVLLSELGDLIPYPISTLRSGIPVGQILLQVGSVGLT